MMAYMRFGLCALISAYPHETAFDNRILYAVFTDIRICDKKRIDALMWFNIRSEYTMRIGKIYAHRRLYKGISA